MASNDRWKDKLEHIEGMDDRHNNRLRRFQKRLFDILVKILGSSLSESDGEIDLTAKNLRASLAVSDAFNKALTDYQETVIKLVRDMLKGSALTDAYLKGIVEGGDIYSRARERSEKVLFRMMGIEPEGKGFKLTKDGFFDVVLNDNSVKTRIQKVTINAVSGGSGLKETLEQIEGVIKGSDGRLGAFERYYKTTVYDGLQQIDRVHNDVLAKELKLEAFIYSGTRIQKTRNFCERKVGKVFLRSEAQEWKTQRWDGKSDNYSPIRDLGGYNCRHTARWISNRRAAQLRDDLQVNEKGELVKV